MSEIVHTNAVSTQLIGDITTIQGQQQLRQFLARLGIEAIDYGGTHGIGSRNDSLTPRMRGIDYAIVHHSHTSIGITNIQVSVGIAGMGTVEQPHILNLDVVDRFIGVGVNHSKRTCTGHKCQRN